MRSRPGPDGPFRLIPVFFIIVGGILFYTITTCLNTTLAVSIPVVLAVVLYYSGIFFVMHDKLPVIDYIQSGEFSVALLSGSISARVFNNDILILLLISFFSVFLFNLFVKYLISPNRKELATIGLIMHVLTIIVFILLLKKDTGFKTAFISNLLTGYLYGHNASHVLLMILGISAGTILLITMPFRQHIYAYPFGKEVACCSGFKYRFLGLFISTARSYTVTIAIIMLGLFGGCALYLFTFIKGTFNKFALSVIILNIILGSLVFFSHINLLYTIGSFVMLSYILFFLALFKHRNMYL